MLLGPTFGKSSICLCWPLSKPTLQMTLLPSVSSPSKNDLSDLVSDKDITIARTEALESGDIMFRCKDMFLVLLLLHLYIHACALRCIKDWEG